MSIMPLSFHEIDEAIEQTMDQGLVIARQQLSESDRIRLNSALSGLGAIQTLLRMACSGASAGDQPHFSSFSVSEEASTST
jgi:hypothetical protein